MDTIKKIVVITALLVPPLYAGKAVRQPVPIVTTRWVDGGQEFSVKGTYLEEEPVFKSFDPQHFYANLLPQGSITYRNNNQNSVESEKLTKLAQTAIDELRAKKTNLTHFKVLKDREFNRNLFVGTIILKYKEYPFVLKLFIDNPKSFVTPTDKSIKHGFMAKMTGGLSRYLSGFTRIKNLEAAKSTMFSQPQTMPVLLDFPRKWFWLPNNVHWFAVDGKNFKTNQQPHTKLPEVYAIIADEIVGLKDTRKLNRYQKRIYALCQTLDYCIDPNMLNYKIERSTNKLVIIDTEHFRGVIGRKDPIVASTHQLLRYQITAKGIWDFLFA